MAEKLSDTEVAQLEELIKTSVAKHYEGELEYWEDIHRKHGPTYTPLDENGINDLLQVLWSNFIAADELERIRTELIQYGMEREYWPAYPTAFCKEEEDEEEKVNLEDRDYEDSQLKLF